MIKEFDLWEGDAPGYVDGQEAPKLRYFPSAKKLGDGAVLIFAGGGYSHRAVHESDGYAEFLNAAGIDAFVLDYRVSPYLFPYPLLDARRAMRFIRANAADFGIDPGKIAVMGSSAGGHLAAITSTYTEPLEGEGADALDAVDFMPNAQILCYPVLDPVSNIGSYMNLLGDQKSYYSKLVPQRLANANTPRAFIWHTSTDKAVDAGCSMRYANKLHELGVSVELHVYPFGPHGQGLANDERHVCPYVTGWANNLCAWLKLIGFIADGE